jgi:hypothetical protein
MPDVISFEEAKKRVGPRGPDRHSPDLSPERCALLQAFWNWHCLAESEDVPEVGELMHCVLLSTNNDEPFLKDEQKALLTRTTCWYWDLTEKVLEIGIEAYERHLDGLPDPEMRQLAASLEEWVRPSWAMQLPA